MKPKGAMNAKSSGTNPKEQKAPKAPKPDPAIAKAAKSFAGNNELNGKWKDDDHGSTFIGTRSAVAIIRAWSAGYSDAKRSSGLPIA